MGKNETKNIVLLSSVLITIFFLFSISNLFKHNGNPRNNIDMQQPALSSEEEKLWITYQSKNDPELSFKYPPDWAFSKRKTISKYNEGVDITSKNGVQVWFEYDPLFLGGISSCDRANCSYLKSVTPLLYAENLFLVNEIDASGVEHYGIEGATVKNGQLYPPQEGNTGRRFLPLSFNKKTNPDVEIAFSFSYGPNTNMEDVKTAIKILASLRY